MDLREVLNFTQLEKLLGYFSLLTGLDAVLHDTTGTVLLARRRSGIICEEAGACSLCREHLAAGGKKSMELGEPYIYACGCGLVMCSSPVVFNEALIGSIACGPAMLWEADEIALEEIIKKTSGMDLSVNEELLKSIPSYECLNITAAAQLLFIMVNSLTREHSRFLQQRERITEQQGTIANLIMERKINAAGIREIEKRSALAYPVDKEKELIAFVQSGKKQQAAALLNDILSEIFSMAEGSMDTMRVKLFELLAFLSRAAVDAGAPLKEVNAITKEAFEICEDHTGFEQLCFLTTKAMEGFIDTVYRNRDQKLTSFHLTNAIEYIQEHYMEDLPLGAVASSVYVSEYYLSHLFRKEMNQTFSDYTAKVRIGKAREFLREDPSVRIQEVADRTGFNDPNYFAKIFKKYTGVSPREYQGFFK
ncbi:MAG: PocR ligand-binding domain-containing protein [Treponema sp.]|jgi:two-component system response regulator YesN|nr:PocR ligand-binding domain-containing protein [Treponema sp.]